MKLPQLFEDRMKQLLGDEYSDYENCLDVPHYGGLRINTMKISPDEFEKICPFTIERIPWIKNGYYYDTKQQPARHPYYYSGMYYIQEPSAMTPASLLPIDEGDKVLDLCAAPGGKSTELGARLNGTGLLVSNDISNSRAKALLKNIELFGIRNGVVVTEAPDKLTEYFPEYFDKILIDAPCSGEGMFRKSPDLIKSWEERGVEYYSDLQRDIILSAAKMLKPGGYMLYSTCTFSPEENESTIAYLLEQCPEFTVVNALPSKDLQKELGLSYDGFGTGMPEWIDNGTDQLKHCIRLWPHRIKGEGHFMALLRKGKSEKNSYEISEGISDSESISEKASKGKILKSKKVSKGEKASKGEKVSKVDKYSLSDEAMDFIKSLNIDIPINSSKDLTMDFDDLMVREDRVYHLPKGFPNLNGLRLLRNGLLLGEMKKQRFEPSQALASALYTREYNKVIHISIGDPNVIRYLKCESITLEGAFEDGWYVVCVENYPLGWCKITKQNLKNKYSPGWRWV